MKIKLHFILPLLIITADLKLITSYAQPETRISSYSLENHETSLSLWQDLEIQIHSLASRYANIRSREKICEFITSDLNLFLLRWYEEGIIKGNKPEEAYILNIGLGKSLKGRMISEVIIVDIGLAIHQPSIYTIRRIAIPLKSKTFLPDGLEHPLPNMNAYGIKC